MEVDGDPVVVDFVSNKPKHFGFRLEEIDEGRFHAVCAIKPNSQADDELEIGDILVKVGPITIPANTSTEFVSKTVQQAGRHKVSKESPMTFVFVRPDDLSIDEEIDEESEWEEESEEENEDAPAPAPAPARVAAPPVPAPRPTGGKAVMVVSPRSQAPAAAPAPAPEVEEKPEEPPARPTSSWSQPSRSFTVSRTVVPSRTVPEVSSWGAPARSTQDSALPSPGAIQAALQEAEPTPPAVSPPTGVRAATPASPTSQRPASQPSPVAAPAPAPAPAPSPVPSRATPTPTPAVEATPPPAVEPAAATGNSGAASSDRPKPKRRSRSSLRRPSAASALPRADSRSTLDSGQGTPPARRLPRPHSHSTLDTGSEGEDPVVAHQLHDSDRKSDGKSADSVDADPSARMDEEEGEVDDGGEWSATFLPRRRRGSTASSASRHSDRAPHVRRRRRRSSTKRDVLPQPTPQPPMLSPQRAAVRPRGSQLGGQPGIALPTWAQPGYAAPFNPTLASPPVKMAPPGADPLQGGGRSPRTHTRTLAPGETSPRPPALSGHGGGTWGSPRPVHAVEAPAAVEPSWTSSPRSPRAPSWQASPATAMQSPRRAAKLAPRSMATEPAYASPRRAAEPPPAYGSPLRRPDAAPSSFGSPLGPAQRAPRRAEAPPAAATTAPPASRSQSVPRGRRRRSTAVVAAGTNRRRSTSPLLRFLREQDLDDDSDDDVLEGMIELGSEEEDSYRHRSQLRAEANRREASVESDRRLRAIKDGDTSTEQLLRKAARVHSAIRAQKQALRVRQTERQLRQVAGARDAPQASSTALVASEDAREDADQHLTEMRAQLRAKQAALNKLLAAAKTLPPGMLKDVAAEEGLVLTGAPAPTTATPPRGKSPGRALSVTRPTASSLAKKQQRYVDRRAAEEAAAAAEEAEEAAIGSAPSTPRRGRSPAPSSGKRVARRLGDFGDAFASGIAAMVEEEGEADADDDPVVVPGLTPDEQALVDAARRRANRMMEVEERPRKAAPAAATPVGRGPRPPANDTGHLPPSTVALSPGLMRLHEMRMAKASRQQEPAVEPRQQPAARQQQQPHHHQRHRQQSLMDLAAEPLAHPRASALVLESQPATALPPSPSQQEDVSAHGHRPLRRRSLDHREASGDARPLAAHGGAAITALPTPSPGVSLAPGGRMEYRRVEAVPPPRAPEPPLAMRATTQGSRGDGAVRAARRRSEKGPNTLSDSAGPPPSLGAAPSRWRDDTSSESGRSSRASSWYVQDAPASFGPSLGSRGPHALHQPQSTQPPPAARGGGWLMPRSAATRATAPLPRPSSGMSYAGPASAWGTQPAAPPGRHHRVARLFG